jgi:hypothetical protein
MLGGLLGSKTPVDPTKVTAHAAEKVHGPFPVSVTLKEFIDSDSGKRTVGAAFTATTSKGEASGITDSDFLDSAEALYKGRLKEKNKANAAARSAAIAAKAAANKARANAEAKIALNKADAEEKARVLGYLKNKKIISSTGMLSRKLSNNDRKRYNMEMLRNKAGATVGGTRRRRHRR